jgi:ABC-type hemin transport system substrate-binding protein
MYYLTSFFSLQTYHDPIDSWVRKLKVKVIEFPQKADLEAVLKRAKSLKVLVPEEEKLDELMSKYEQWMVCSCKI